MFVKFFINLQFGEHKQSLNNLIVDFIFTDIGIGKESTLRAAHSKVTNQQTSPTRSIFKKLFDYLIIFLSFKLCLYSLFDNYLYSLFNLQTVTNNNQLIFQLFILILGLHISYSSNIQACATISQHQIFFFQTFSFFTNAANITW